MDSNLIFSFLILLLIGLIVTIIDEALILLIFGFGLAAFSWSLESTFSITTSSYAGFGLIIILSYWFLDLFCFAKILTSGIEIFGKKVEHK